jgi:uroporphyrinogen-III synthase
MEIDQNNISARILSTAPLDESVIELAAEQGVRIDSIPFISVEPIRTAEVAEEIEAALQLRTTVIFTSVNAVEAVAEIMQDQQPEWQIYCIGQKTKDLVEKYFGQDAIIGTADYGVQLADRIIEDELAEEVVFFCGSMRRPELPDMLFAAGILVTEVMVYETIPVTHQLKENYAAVLFYSPSAVNSFFEKNKLPEHLPSEIQQPRLYENIARTKSYWQISPGRKHWPKKPLRSSGANNT